MLILPSKTVLSAAARKKSGGGSGDPYFANVSLLLHFNGANGSTVFTDSSTNAFVGSRQGNTVISTAQSKFGGASAAFDGAGDGIGYADAVPFQFGTGDFTVEFWIYFNSIPAETIISTGASNNTVSLRIHHFSSTGWRISTLDATTLLSTGVVSSLNTWQHVAFTRSSGNLRAFLNGVQMGATVSRPNNYILSGGGMNLGQTSGLAGTLNGYLDDYRITKGVARYTANFTPPAAQFPDS